MLAFFLHQQVRFMVIQKYTHSLNPIVVVISTIGIRSCYDEGKRIAETLCFDYKRMHGCEIRIARIFNTYGPRMHPNDGRVISNFIVQALRGEAITLYGDGTQTRSFCYVDDLVDGLINLMNSSNTGPINLGNPNEFSIRELAECVRTRINPNIPLTLKPLPQDDPRQRKPDITLARRFLNWEPTIELEKGLDMTIDYFRDLLSTKS